MASTQEESYGNQLVAKLKALGFQAQLVSAEVPGKGVWFRIRVGNYGDR